ncbi:MAG: cupredoxin domain-containing protein [Nitrosopumilus sp.]
MGAIGVLISIIIGVSFSIDPVNETENTDVIVQADVIMPTKVSRPGCEEQDRCYIPSQITIDAGNQVTWINEDSAFHSVTSGFYNEPTEFFDSGYLDPYQSFSFTFETIGIFDYYCTLHPWMAGQIIVE